MTTLYVYAGCARCSKLSTLEWEEAEDFDTQTWTCLCGARNHSTLHIETTTRLEEVAS